MMIWTRTLTALLLAAVLTRPAGALDFTPCTEQGHEAFDCASLPVPIDRDGTVPGTIGLHVERLRGQIGHAGSTGHRNAAANIQIPPSCALSVPSRQEKAPETHDRRRDIVHFRFAV
jgi:hypothetical protein